MNGQVFCYIHCEVSNACCWEEWIGRVIILSVFILEGDLSHCHWQALCMGILSIIKRNPEPVQLAASSALSCCAPVSVYCYIYWWKWWEKADQQQLIGKPPRMIVVYWCCNGLYCHSKPRTTQVITYYKRSSFHLIVYWTLVGLLIHLVIIGNCV